MNSVKLAIFDCDGTLVDSGATIFAALKTSLEAHGRAAPSASAARRVIGLSLFQAIELLEPRASAEEIGAIADTYRNAFHAMRAAGEVEEPLYEGVAELIDAFANDGWALAVATGKSERGLRHCLAAHGLDGCFVSLQTADCNPSKPHPAMALGAIAEAGALPANSVMIGDTAWDMGCAKAAGAGAIGVTWGYHAGDELLGAGADCLAASPSEVLAMAQALIETAR